MRSGIILNSRVRAGSAREPAHGYVYATFVMPFTISILGRDIPNYLFFFTLTNHDMTARYSRR